MTRDSRPAGRPKGRSTSRSSAARRGPGRPAASPGGATGRLAALRERTRRRPQSMKRLTILGGLLLFLAVIVTPTLNSYLQQRHQIDQLGQQVTQQRKDVAAKQAELKRWDDPAYVKQQARTRLGFVTPGETLTVLVDENGKAVGAVDPAGKKVSTNPWYGQLWQSTLGANRDKQ